MYAKDNLEREVELLKERLDARERAWNSSREELSQRLSRVSEIEMLKPVHHLKVNNLRLGIRQNYR